MTEPNHPFSAATTIAVTLPPARATARGVLVTASAEVAKQALNQSVKRGATALAKGGANPAFVACDLVEIGVERATGDKVIAKGSSLLGYVGVGAACGGPAGAAVGAASWGFSQIVSLAFE